MAERISVDFDAVARHATRIEMVAADIRLAQDAANSTNFGGGAFGIMCAFMVPPVNLVGSVARATIASAAELVDRSATGIREVGEEFQQFEEQASTMYRGIQDGALGGGSGQ